MTLEPLRNIYGSMVFCPECGKLLDPVTETNKLECQACGNTMSVTSVDKIEIHTSSRDSAFPSALRNKRSLVQNDMSKMREEAATVAQTCEKCGAEEMEYYTRQMRSADEGQTVFYTCRKCGYKYSVNS
ncbi:DNA-directed RNA polymerase I core subunit rpa12 [Dispira parvispora]|uniref:DNA-directed RNA polymerase subunit n=1 Tax=Dispira parvispora TaxID=1520584 RepID=A0A9W8AJI3_9FUNG|nr:DNA-directed RNA polymerase I core subunit rpa12 [Dispira parvispora]